jgi:MSHA biogenesis protein MshK
MAGGLRRGSALALALCALAGTAAAMDDPTRPPAGLRAGPVRAAAGDGLVLQSVIIAEDRRSAIISGEHVLLGGKIGAARLVKVSEGSVVLMIGGNRRRLELFPTVEKHRAARDAAEE